MLAATPFVKLDITDETPLNTIKPFVDADGVTSFIPSSSNAHQSLQGYNDIGLISNLITLAVSVRAVLGIS